MKEEKKEGKELHKHIQGLPIRRTMQASKDPQLRCSCNKGQIKNQHANGLKPTKIEP